LSFPPIFQGCAKFKLQIEACCAEVERVRKKTSKKMSVSKLSNLSQFRALLKSPATLSLLQNGKLASYACESNIIRQDNIGFSEKNKNKNFVAPVKSD
jgi:hypothetical protein